VGDGHLDIDKGLAVAGHNGGKNGEAATAAIATDPIAAIRSVNALATPEGSVLMVLPNFHRFLQSTEIVQALAHQIHAGKNNRTFIVVLSPVVQIPRSWRSCSRSSNTTSRKNSSCKRSPKASRRRRTKCPKATTCSGS